MKEHNNEQTEDAMSKPSDYIPVELEVFFANDHSMLVKSLETEKRVWLPTKYCIHLGSHRYNVPLGLAESKGLVR